MRRICAWCNDGGTLQADGSRLTFQNCNSLTFFLAAGTDYVDGRQPPLEGRRSARARDAADKHAARKPFADLLAAHERDYRRFLTASRLILDTSAPERAALPTDQQAQRLCPRTTPTRTERALLPIRPLPADFFLPPRLAARQLAGPVERQQQSALALRLPLQHQLPDELLACRGDQPLRVPPAHAGSDPGTNPRVPPADAGRARISARRLAPCAAGRSARKRVPGAARRSSGTRPPTPGTASTSGSITPTPATRTYLKNIAYPILKETVEFWEDHLKALPDGTLVAPLGWSPEHGPTEDGVSYDQEILWDLFTNLLRGGGRPGR